MHGKCCRGTDVPKLAILFLDHLELAIENEIDSMYNVEIIGCFDAQSASSIVGVTIALIRDRFRYAIEYECEIVGLGLRLWL